MAIPSSGKQIHHLSDILLFTDAALRHVDPEIFAVDYLS